MVELLDQKQGEKVLVDEVLLRSGISRGSLYHHFGDYPNLVQEGKIYQFSRYVNGTIQAMTGLLDNIKTPQELKLALFQVTIKTQRDELALSRATRAGILAEASSNPEFKQKLGGEIDRLTKLLEDLIQEAINRKWFVDTFPARTIAIFIQTYTLGKILNDFSSDKVSEDDWNFIINSIIGELFINN